MKINIPTINNDPFLMDFGKGQTTIILGPNGSGKTRLSVYIFNQIIKINERAAQIPAEIAKLKSELDEFNITPDSHFANIMKQYSVLKVETDGVNTSLFDYVSNVVYLSSGNSGKMSFGNFREIDIALLRFSEVFRQDPQKAVGDYRQEIISNIESEITKKKDEISVLGNLWLERGYRIRAHRALTFGENVNPTNAEQAVNQLNLTSKNQKTEITKIQDDFSKLLQALYSEEAEQSSNYVQSLGKADTSLERPNTSVSKLINLWNDLLPHRELSLENIKIQVRVPMQTAQYQASEMSDGERNMLYVMGKCLLAPTNSLLIVDEPELHINKSIMNDFWDKIRDARKDCGFLFVTHDVDFVLANSSARISAVDNYEHPEKWGVSWLDEADREEIQIKILGSRKKILFVEGTIAGSLDHKIYSKVYPDFLVIPVGSCEQVKHRVKAMKNNASLHHVECFGIIDRDTIAFDAVTKLSDDGIFVSKFAIIENMLLSEEVAKTLWQQKNMGKNWDHSQYEKEILHYCTQHKTDDMEKRAKACAEFEFRAILNKAKNGEVSDFSDIDLAQIRNRINGEFDELIRSSNISGILGVYRNKGLYKTILGKFLNAKDTDLEVKSLLWCDAVVACMRDALPKIPIASA